MKKVIYTRPDGGVSVVSPAVGFVEETLSAAQRLGVEMTEEQLVVICTAKALHHADQGTNAKLIDERDIPKDKHYRDAWVQKGNVVDVDLPKARDIVRERIRRGREGEFVKLDAAFTRALGTGDEHEAKKIEAARQQLRDAPADPRIEKAKDVDELMQIEQEIVPGS